MTTLHDFTGGSFPGPDGDLDVGRSHDERERLWSTLDDVTDQHAAILARRFDTLGEGTRQILTPVGTGTWAGLNEQAIETVRAALYDLGHRPVCDCDHPADTDCRVGRLPEERSDPSAPVLTRCAACGTTLGETAQWWRPP